MAYEFVEQNRASAERLAERVKGLSDSDLALWTDSGWTVAALLAHLAYWDQRMLALMRRWETSGVDESPVDPDAINDALLPLCLALAPRAAVRLCLESAAAVDAKLASLDAQLVAAIQASANHFRFNRGLHRDGHLAEIERTLATAR